jgi:hypothetical protein
MTRRTNARIAGVTYLLYIAVAFPSMVLFGRATTGQGISAKLLGLADHATEVRISILLSVISCFCALVLAVTLYAITRDEDSDLARLAMACRIGEGVIGGATMVAGLGLLWLATMVTGPNAPDAASSGVLGMYLLKVDGWGTATAATFFALGSTLFSYLFLRARTIPVSLAWLGVVASLLVLVALPAQLADFLHGPVLGFMWIPMLVFEVSLALWLIIKGVASPATR